MSLTSLCNVFADNLITEFDNMMQIAKYYKVIAIDTEFPGALEKKPFWHGNAPEAEWSYVNNTVPRTKCIQLAFSFFREDGSRPVGVNTWQFNFLFDPSKDLNDSNSIKFLVEHGLDIKQLAHKGIEHMIFAQLLARSGLLLAQDITWVLFYGNFDLAYILCMVYPRRWPSSPKGFIEEVGNVFPRFYDLKVMIQDRPIRARGLQRLAGELGIIRVGQAHSAGSDAFLTGQCTASNLPYSHNDETLEKNYTTQS
uniref:poly(A)-specific ribonuclease n=1 Tax=Trichogramma kaykai TaxID=54128 RepID=A0ABD2WRZ1_9HYME